MKKHKTKDKVKKPLTKRRKIYLATLISSIILFVGCIGFLTWYLGIQPYLSKKLNDRYKNIYYSAEPMTGGRAEDYTASSNGDDKESKTRPAFALDNDYSKGEKDENGVLVKFHNILSYNSDIQGWLNIPGTNVDYPVLQAFDGSDFYLYRNVEGKDDKNGCLYIDNHCNVRMPTKNIVIHGHNMDYSHIMFYTIPEYKKLDFYKEHPIITFDSVYEEAKWKIISFMRVSGDHDGNGNFYYMKGFFNSTGEYLDFLNEIETRSLYDIPVDVNENDEILMLSTCSYEFNNARSVLVARKVRKGEKAEVDTSKVTVKDNVLYPKAYYSRHGGVMPGISNFRDAYSLDEAKWYKGLAVKESPIGKVFSMGNATYKVLTKDTVILNDVKDKYADTFTVSDTIKRYGNTYKVVGISNGAFKEMTNLTEVAIGDNVTYIPKDLFVECPNLERVFIGSGIVSICESAFDGLSNLNTVVFKGASIDTIGANAFRNISEESTFFVPPGCLNDYKELFNAYGLKETVTVQEAE